MAADPHTANRIVAALATFFIAAAFLSALVSTALGFYAIFSSMLYSPIGRYLPPEVIPMPEQAASRSGRRLIVSKVSRVTPKLPPEDLLCQLSA